MTAAEKMTGSSLYSQALYRCAHPHMTLDQAGCHRDAQLYKQKSAATPKRSFFLCIQRKGEFGALEQGRQKHSLFLKEGLGCACHNKKTKPTAEAIHFPAVFHRDRAPMRCPLIQPGVHFLWPRESIKCPCGSWK